MGLWWLSFADPDQPKGSQFLGVAIVDAVCFEEAVVWSHMLGCNPGGEVQGVDISEEQVPKDFLHRILEMDALNDLKSLVERTVVN